MPTGDSNTLFKRTAYLYRNTNKVSINIYKAHTTTNDKARITTKFIANILILIASSSLNLQEKNTKQNKSKSPIEPNTNQT